MELKPYFHVIENIKMEDIEMENILVTATLL
jgi:hypothetical protein